MGLREQIMPMLDGARQLLGPQFANFRRGQVAVITRAWSGGLVGEGYPTDVTTLQLPAWYAVRELEESEVAGSGGRYRTGTVKVVVTPKVGQVGFSLAEIAPAGSPGIEVVYQITGDIQGEFSRVHVSAHRAFRYELFLERVLP